MPANLSGPTLLVILFIVLLLFGAPKLPALARSLGQSMKILKKEVAPGDDEKKPSDATVDAANVKESTNSANTNVSPSVEEQLAQARAEAEAARAETQMLRQQSAETAAKPKESA